MVQITVSLTMCGMTILLLVEIKCRLQNEVCAKHYITWIIIKQLYNIMYVCFFFSLLGTFGVIVTPQVQILVGWKG